jgi:hypothetical protein
MLTGPDAYEHEGSRGAALALDPAMDEALEVVARVGGAGPAEAAPA